MDCNYMSLRLIPASGTRVLIFVTESSSGLMAFIDVCTQSRWSSVKPERLQCFIDLCPTNSLIKCSTYLGPCRALHQTVQNSRLHLSVHVSQGEWDILLTVARAGQRVVLCGMAPGLGPVASERTTPPLVTRHKAAPQTSYNCVWTSLCGLK